MPETVTAKITSCFEEDTPEKEFIVNGPDGGELCRFVVKQLTIYEINRCKSDDPEKFNVNLIKVGVKKFSTPKGAVVLDDVALANLTKSKFDGSGAIKEGLFEIMAAAVMGVNTVSEGEAKN